MKILRHFVFALLLAAVGPALAAQTYGSGQPTQPTPIAQGGCPNLGNFPSAAILASSYPAIAQAVCSVAYTADQGLMVDTASGWQAISGSVNASQIGAGSLPSGVLSSAGNVLIDTGMVALNLRELGACGIADGTAKFNAATTLAAVTGQALYIPNGCTINHSGSLTLSGLQLLGDGVGSILNATDQTATNPNLCLSVGGSGTVVRGINFQTTNTTSTRATAVCSSALAAASGLTNFSIDHNYFTSQFAATDIQLFNAGTWGEVADNKILVAPLSNPMIFQADGGLGTAPYHIGVHRNKIQAAGVGDTGIEMTYAVTYLDVGENDIDSAGAHCISVIGGQHIGIHDNTCTNPTARGIDIEANGGFTLAPILDIHTHHNRLLMGATATGTSQCIFVNGNTTDPAQDITLEDDSCFVPAGASNSPYIQVGAGTAAANVGVTLVNETVDGTGGAQSNTAAGVLVDGVTNLLVYGGTFKAIPQAAIQVKGTAINAGAFKVIGAHFISLSNKTSGTFPVIDLGNSGFSTVQIIAPDYEAGANPVSNFLSCTNTSPAVNLLNIIGSDTSVSGCTSISASPSANVQVFTSSGTWTKPPVVNGISPQVTRLIVIGAGGGGGSGANIASGTSVSGGAGGGAGWMWDLTFPTSTLGSTETVTVGAAGTGGTPNAGAAGSVGGVGGTSSFGAWLAAFGGGGGSGGQSAANSGGGASAGNANAGGSGSGTTNGTAGVIGGAAGGANNAGFGGGGGGQVGSNGISGAGGTHTAYGPGGGGAGGGLAASPVNTAGGAGGNAGSLAAPAGGATGGGTGTSAPSTSSGYFFCSGGGGGGASPSGTSGAGGPGCQGSGGGGGASAISGQTAGTGGIGGAGYVVAITTY